MPFDSRQIRLAKEIQELLQSQSNSLDLLETKGVITKEEKDNVKPRMRGGQQEARSKLPVFSSSPLNERKEENTSSSSKEVPKKKPWWKFW